MRLRSTLIPVSILALVLAACGDDDDKKQNATATPTPTDTAAAAATDTPAPTATDTRAPTATDTPEPTATATSAPTDTPTATPTSTQSLVDELTAAGAGKYLGTIAPSGNAPNGRWTRYDYDATTEQAICLRGDPYQVFVHRGTNDKVLLFLEGGGACWDNQSCWVAPTAKVNASPIFGFGILEFDNPDNPFRDWNVVYAPYCDGSVFAGDNIAQYEGGPVYHHGLQNLSAAVTLMREQFPDPEQIVVSGSSAGGYGTYTGYGVTRIAYPEEPILVLNDSGPGLQNPDDPETNEERATNWRFREIVPPSCTQCSEQYTYLTEWALERDPTLRYGLFSYLRDTIIRSFNTLSPEEFEALLREVTGDIQTRHPDRFKRFLSQGNNNTKGLEHTILFFPLFYDLEITGTTVRDWTADFLTDGPAWQDLIEAPNPFLGFSSQRYGPEDLWLCRPDLSVNQCFVSLDATAVQPDNSLVVETHEAAEPNEPELDCFYIYPTVDLSLTPGNHTDFSDISLELDPLLSQAARFNGTCRIFAPLYRQGTIGSFGSPNAEEIFDLAYSDVSEAFRHYMGQYNHGRDFVIMGHSQGTGMTTRLMQEFIDPNPDLRARLAAALLIGGGVAVPQGQTVGGSFQNLPLCTSVEQTGCVIAYRSYADGFPPEAGSNVVDPELDTACTNPAALGGGKGRFGGAYFPLVINQPIFDVGPEPPPGVDTPFILFRDFYAGECVKDDQNRSYLKISVDPLPGDQRENSVPFDAPLFAPGFLGTHVVDYNFPTEELIELVEAKAEALRASR